MCGFPRKIQKASFPLELFLGGQPFFGSLSWLASVMDEASRGFRPGRFRDAAKKSDWVSLAFHPRNPKRKERQNGITLFQLQYAFE